MSILGPFTETNTCGTSVGGGGSCSIAVTWLKTTGGGDVSVSDNCGGSPQTVPLFGNKIGTPQVVDETHPHFHLSPVFSALSPQDAWFRTQWSAGSSPATLLAEVPAPIHWRCAESRRKRDEEQGPCRKDQHRWFSQPVVCPTDSHAYTIAPEIRCPPVTADRLQVS